MASVLRSLEDIEEIAKAEVVAEVPVAAEKEKFVRVDDAVDIKPPKKSI